MLWRRINWLKDTNFSEETAASILRVDSINTDFGDSISKIRRNYHAADGSRRIENY
jgi:hypothetical protein